MTREEAIEELEKSRRLLLAWELPVEELDIAIEALKEPHWIPCSERLPELTQYGKDIGAYSWKESDFVLVSTKNGLVGMASLEEDADGKAWMSDDDFVMQDIDSFTDVTAWMPLPKPYKRGE